MNPSQAACSSTSTPVVSRKGMHVPAEVKAKGRLAVRRYKEKIASRIYRLKKKEMDRQLWSTLIGAEAFIRQLQEQVRQLQVANQELNSAGLLSSMKLRNHRERVAAVV